MAIRRNKKKKFKKITWQSGHIYTFKYQAWQNDPHPVIILMYALEGRHPNTGNQWRFFQGINFTYIPRSMRRAFIKNWLRIWDNSTWTLHGRQSKGVILGCKKQYEDTSSNQDII